MRLIIKYYLTDGIALTPLSDELSWFTDVKTFSDYVDKLAQHIMITHSDFYHVVIKSIKVIDLPLTLE